MSCLSPHHEQLNELGEGCCSVPMWWGMGMAAGFCDRPAYGKRPEGRTHTRWDGFEWRDDGLYTGYVPGLACPIHGGPIVRTFMDGNAWCAVNPDFINLQESPAGFGDDREAAITALTHSAEGHGNKP
jgi:hypothetical protein